MSDDFDKFWRTFLMLPLDFIINDFDLVIEAAKINAQYPISYTDCFAVATAIKENASIITGDTEFRRVQDIVEIVWL